MLYLQQPAEFDEIAPLRKMSAHANVGALAACLLTLNSSGGKKNPTEIEDVPQVYSLYLISHKGGRFRNQLKLQSYETFRFEELTAKCQ